MQRLTPILFPVLFFLLLPSPAISDRLLLYVARFMDGDITVVDGSTGEAVKRITLGFRSNPVEIISSPDGTSLYVSQRGYDEIAVIDLKTDSITRRIKVGLHPNFMAFTPNGRYLIVANNQAEYASIIDTSTHIVVASVTVGTGSSGVAVTDDSRLAYITAIYSNSISVIDLERMERIAVIDVPAPIGIVIPRGTGTAYFCSHRNRVSILDLKSNTITGHIPVGDTPNYIVLSRDEKKAFVTNALSGSVSVIDLAEKRHLKEIKVGSEPLGARLSPDGRLLFVVNYGDGDEDGTLSVIDTSRLEEIKRLSFRRYPRAIEVVR